MVRISGHGRLRTGRGRLATKLLVGAVTCLSVVVLSRLDVAAADTVRIPDTQGDSRRPYLDIQRVKVANSPGLVLSTISFDRIGAGHLYVTYKDPHRRAVTIHARWRRTSQAFEAFDLDGRLDCPGLAVKWTRNTASTRLPDRCWQTKKGSSIRVIVSTEAPFDNDVAPNTTSEGPRWSRIVRQG